MSSKALNSPGETTTLGAMADWPEKEAVNVDDIIPILTSRFSDLPGGISLLHISSDTPVHLPVATLVAYAHEPCPRTPQVDIDSCPRSL